MIKISSIYKSFNGVTILEDINLNIQGGQIFCLLGKNGVGKTTLFNLILNLMKPDKGIIELFSIPNNKIGDRIKQKIGVLREDLATINELTGYDFLLFIGCLYKVPKAEIDHKISELADYFLEGKGNELKNRIENYSYGTKKKIAIISALLNEPKILLLDEPFAGLDPISSRKLISYIKEYQNNERVIFLSSHNLNYVKQISTHIGILHNKRLLFNSIITEFPIKKGELFEEAFCRMIES